MENKSELIAKLKKGKAIMDEIKMKEQMANNELSKGGCTSFFIFLIAGSLIWYLMFYLLNISFLISTITTLLISLVIFSYFTVKQSKKDNKQHAVHIIQTEIPQLKDSFKRICGFSIDQYEPIQMDQIIELLESGEADTWKEALLIIRTINQHIQLMEENKKLEDKLNETNKTLRKEIKQMEKKTGKLNSKIDDLEDEVDFYKYH